MRQLTHRERRIGIAVLALALFAFYSVTAWHVINLPVFSSPDETANFRFAQQVRATGVPSTSTTLPGSPRSVLNTGIALVPGSFPFFPWLLGQIGHLAGTFGILMLGPILATLAVFAWYSFLRRIGGPKRFALYATVIFATFPITWFYASRGLWQNGVFTSGIVLCLWLTAFTLKHRQWYFSILTGLVWGVTIMIRPSEVSWIAFGALVFVVSQWKRIPWRLVGIVVVTAVLPFILALSIQRMTYGNATTVGYRTEGILAPAATLVHASVLAKVSNIFFPFGMNIRTAARTFWHQYVYLFWFLFFPSAAGICLLFFRKRSPNYVRWLLGAGCVSAFFLVMLYGNYQFIEYPVSRVPTLDSSYERYWLPLILLTSVGSGWLLYVMRRWQIGKFVMTLLLAGWLGWSSWTLWQTNIGVRYSFPLFTQWQQQVRWVEASTSTNAVLVGVDKVVRPPRHAIGTNRNSPINVTILASIARTKTPIYLLITTPSAVPEVVGSYPGFRAATVVIGPGGLTLAELQSTQP